MIITRSTGLVLYVKYDPTTGTFKDYSRNHHTITNTDVTITRGKFGGAGAYNGWTSYLNCGNDSALDITDAVTVEAWYKPPQEYDHGTAFHHLVTKCAQHHTGYLLIIQYATYPNQIRFGTHGDSNRAVWPITEYGKWYHLVGTIDASKVKLYVNGELKHEVGSVGIPSNIEPLRIMGGVSSRYSHGTIDEVRIYNRALTAAEILKHYKQKGYYGGLVESPISI